MFDPKKLFDALATPAASAQPPAPATPPATPGAAPAPAAPAFGAGTLLSELIGYATKDTPPPPPPPQPAADKPESEPAPQPAPPKPATAPDFTDHLLAKTQDYLRSPQGNAAMNALVLGLVKFVATSDTGRKLASSAKAGGMALIGELTQKARRTQPAGSAAEPSAAADTPLLILRTMIAAAAADGEIDAAERQRILDGARQAGMAPEIARFVENEMARPASIAAIAACVKDPDTAAQVYTAARVTIDPDRTEERVFLAQLAGALNLEARVVAGIDAAASAA
jgi:uncharacterized membrane protein YebE (DUF533 family)